MKKAQLLIPLLALTATAKATTQPNVIVIMADDLGYQDLGFQGSPIVKTPNLDKLAHEGVIFTNAHVSASVCSPSRAGFMTGRYQQRFGHEANCPRGTKGMDTSEFTIGQAFKSLNYNTYLLGKWHLGSTDAQYPTARGFDEFWGLREGSRSFFCKKGGDKVGNPHSIEHNGQHVDFKGHLTDRQTDEAIRMVKENGKKPFFMFLSYTAPHAPLQATKEDLQKANGNAYHALIQNLDDNIGRFLATLESQGIRKNTMIWFLSDNGGTVGSASNFPLNGKKGIELEGGHRVPFVFNWPGHVPAGKVFNGLTSSLDIFATSFKVAGGEKTPRPLDGVDILPFITGEKDGNPHQVLFWRKLEGAAIINGNWKLIRAEGLKPMLYNLNDDKSELNNLAATMPEKVQDLQEQLSQWEKELVDPLWQEGKGFIAIRKSMYLKFTQAGKIYAPLNAMPKKNKK